MPDFDIDFCQDRRDEVIRYVQDNYGADRVAQIITFGKLQARAVLRDVGRVLQMPYGQVDKLCKLVPNNPANPVTLEQAIDGEPMLQEARDADESVARLIEIALQPRRPLPPRLDARGRRGDRRPAAGRAGAALPRPALRHAGHPVQHEICRTGRAGEVRLPRPEDADRASARGRADRRARRSNSISTNLPLDDARAYEMLARGDTAGVFQLESSGMRDVLRRLQAQPLRGHHRAGGALPSRPDGQHPDLHRGARTGEEEPDYLHPLAGADPEGNLRRSSSTRNR